MIRDDVALAPIATVTEVGALDGSLMWRRIPVSYDKQYVLNLCQDAKGYRFCVVTEAGSTAPDMVRQVTEISSDLIRRYAVHELEKLPLSDGSHFVFGPHGEWFTIAEEEALADDQDDVPWITSVAPTLPPK
jgi:hypothetical protein